MTEHQPLPCTVVNCPGGDPCPHEQERIHAIAMAKTERQPEPPYLERIFTRKVWNPNYKQDARCICGHTYDRHFDSYDNMENVGCKYCDCLEFIAVAADGERAVSKER